MTRKTTLTVASALVLALAAGAAQAWPHGDRAGAPGRGPHMMMPSFEELDTDGDGRITREELEAKRLERIRSMDPDGDGFITLEEMKTRAGEEARKRAEAMAERMFTELDADKDGKISAAEALGARMAGPQGMERLFDRVDADDDGAVSKAEFDRAAERMQRMRGDGPRGQGMHGEGRHGMGPRGDHGRPPMPPAGGAEAPKPQE